MKMASCVPGELIPCAFVWHDPGITPCCKSPKLPGDDFLTVRRPDRRTPVCAASMTLPGSPVSLSVGDEAPHIFTRRSRLKPGEFLITSAKRLLQHNLPETDIAACRGAIFAHGHQGIHRPRSRERGLCPHGQRTRCAPCDPRGCGADIDRVARPSKATRRRTRPRWRRSSRVGEPMTNHHGEPAPLVRFGGNGDNS
jgi:hypothetical protein